MNEKEALDLWQQALDAYRHSPNRATQRRLERCQAQYREAQAKEDGKLSMAIMGFVVLGLLFLVILGMGVVATPAPY